MKKTSIFSLLFIGLLAFGLTACEKDDTTDFSAYISNPQEETPDPQEETPEEPDDSTDNEPIVVAGSDTLYIAYDGATATVTGDEHGYVSVSGADVIVNALEADTTMLIVLSGTTTDGSLLVYRQKAFTLQLNGVSITNPDGPAINNQCGKALYVDCVEGTENTLTDGEAYGDAPVNGSGEPIDQKGTLFSEGQIYFIGQGALTVKGNAKNGIASDDYIIFQRGTVTVNVSETGSNGIKVNDGIAIEGGTLKISVEADGARGIRSEAYTTVSGGTTTITTKGDCKIETVDGEEDASSAAGIKCDSVFTMNGGTLTITSSGDGGKGINCSQNVEVSGGTLTVKTTGSNEDGKPKGVKSDTGIIVSGGSFEVTVKKSWACDNGTDSETPDDHLTVIGTPTTKSIAKKAVTVKF